LDTAKIFIELTHNEQGLTHASRSRTLFDPSNLIHIFVSLQTRLAAKIKDYTQFSRNDTDIRPIVYKIDWDLPLMSVFYKKMLYINRIEFS
jgi:hypothetical protein